MSLKKKVVWLPYDFDTAIGINNEGELVFDYRLEDIDQQQSGADVFNGQQSVIWKNVRAVFLDDVKSMYATLRSSGALSYEKVERMFEEHQSKWPEAIFNEDAWFKYILPFINENTDYLGMLLGKKEEQRKWWLYNRFRYVDSWAIAGDALTDTITIRPYAAANLSLTPYADIYATAKWDDYITQERAARGAAVILICPYSSMNDNVLTVYSASQLASIGDISGLKPGLVDISNATRLQSLKVGDSDSQYDNANLRALTLGNNVLLRTVDARNCSGLGDTSIQGHTQQVVDLSGCEILENVYFEGTKVTGITLPNGGVLKVVHLPETITNLTIMNQKSITDLTVGSYSNISTLRLENVPTIDSEAILRVIPAGARVRLIGFYWTATDAAEISALFDLLDTMRGLDESGGNVLTAQVSGEIHTGSLTGAEIADFNSRYPYVNVTADHVTSYLTYKTWDGSSTLKTVTCIDGVPQESGPSSPTRSSTAQYSYSFVGWNTKTDQQAAESGCTENVTADRTVYAAYSRTVRQYVITWKNDNGTTLKTTTYNYGDYPSYGSTTPVSGIDPSYTFLNWSPTPSMVTGTQIYTAQYKTPASVEVPTATDATGAYGVEWDYSQSATTLTRKGLAASLSNPTPATSLAGSGSSPFDSIAPWKDMKRYNIINGAVSYSQDDAGFSEMDYDTVVYIPEFYYTAYKDTANSKWLWAISPTALEGYVKHPGSGRYIGRFHTSGDSTEVFSKSGVAPLVSKTRPDFRTYSHNKGSNWWMLDLASWSALQMLYLVEFADFHSQNTLGTGHVTGSAGNTGGTAGAAYHTLKISSGDNMYRWVENPFSQVYDWVDGAYFSSRAVYVGTNNATFADSSSALNAAGFSLPNSGFITGFGYSEECPFAFVPDAASGGSASTYVSDYVYSSSSIRALFVGGNYNASDYYGFFCFNGSYYASSAGANLGSRLLYIP